LKSRTTHSRDRCVLLERKSVLPPRSSARNQARGASASKTEESGQADNAESYLPSANTREKGRLSADRFNAKVREYTAFA